MNNLTSSLVLGGLLFLVGCGREPLPPAPDAGTARILPAWSALTNAAALKEIVHSGEATPPAALPVPGVLELDVDFTGAKPPIRMNWDLKFPCDLRLCPGIQFDFYCEDLSQFSHFSCYFRSGDGWYHGSFAPEEDGWQRVTVTKAQAGVEGSTDGWGAVRALRISGWRAGTGRTRCAIANVAVIGGNADVAVVYADSLAVKGGGEAKSYLTFAANIATSLRALGLDPVVVADRDLTPDILKRMKGVILPYNPKVPEPQVRLLMDYVSAGGRLLACYVQPKAVLDLLGIRLAASRRPGDDGGPSIGGFLRVGKGLEGQPDFSPQASWMTQVPVRQEGTEVLAEWADGRRNTLGIPALVRTNRGLYMSHVWLGGVEGAPAALMRALAIDLSPALEEKIAANESAAQRRAEEQRAWLAKCPSKKGEHRAFWCHSARGLGGDRDWDASVKYLKDNGFNTILPNLCWGGVAFYPSQVLPVSPDVATKGDAFVQCRDACRKYGVKMHVWKVCWNMGSHTAQSVVDQMQADGRTQVDAKGKGNPRWLCPSHPDNQKLEIEAMVELAKMKPDGIHFDYIRYPSSENCFCAGCRERFEALVGTSVTNWPGDVRGDGPLNRKWRDFRADNITRVVRTVATRVRAEAPGVQISAALFRNPVSDRETVGQDWPRWCREGWLDFACNMDYVDSSAMFRSQVKAQTAAVGKVRLYPGIGLSCWQNDGMDGVKLAKQIQVARDLGLGGFTVFNFDRRAERVLPLMRTGVTRED